MPDEFGQLELLESRASIENPAVSLQDPSQWEDLFGFKTKSASGKQVTPRTSLNIAAVWQAVSMISGDVARLPLDVYKRGTGDSRSVDKNHPAWWVVRRQANDEQHAFRFWRNMLVHALIFGNGYAYIRKNGRGEAVELIPLLPDRTRFHRYIDGKLYVQTEVSYGPPALRRLSNGVAGSYMKFLDPTDVYHIAGIGFDFEGEYLVHAARDAWGLALAQQGFASKYFASGGRVGGILEVPQRASVEFANKLEEGFRRTYEQDDAWFRTVILRDGAKFTEASRSPLDSQMVEASERQAREVARYFNIPPARLGLSDSVSYNSQSEANQSYLDTTLSPWLNEITHEADRKLLSKQQQQADTHYFEHNTSALLRMNQSQRYQNYAIGIRNGWLCPDDALRAENMPIREEGGDEYVSLVKTPTSPGGADKGENNKPRGPANDNNEVPADSGPPKDGMSEDAGDATSTQDTAEQKSARVRRIYLIAHAARRKSADGRGYAGWLNSGLKELADDDSLSLRFAEELRDAKRLPVADLPSRVEELSRHFEQEVLQ